MSDSPRSRPRGRGSVFSPAPRYGEHRSEAFDDGWTDEDPVPEQIDTRVREVAVKSIISSNQSPDVPFDLSINPYQGCEHGCVYCYARPTHAWLDLSPGLDFESRLVAKTNALECLRAELAAPSYRCKPITLGANTDAYQPIERHYELTRSIIETLVECSHPFVIISKSALLERDLDLLAKAGEQDLVRVFISITTLDKDLARSMEPRAASPARRLKLLRTLHEAGVPTGVLVAPIIPALTDHEPEAILDSAAAAGVGSAGYVLLRLPLEIRDMFDAWLQAAVPLRAKHVMSRLASMRDGGHYQNEFGKRMRGTGEDARLLARRFERQCRRFGLNRYGEPLDCSRFRPPSLGGQLDMF